MGRADRHCEVLAIDLWLFDAGVLIMVLIYSTVVT